ncbi:hypothetical protein AruPA_15215 [Acidiphilium sp. PA]|uniref:hypothetical protein n=1 Tax=Acidiphilium sp. PA TaxID=2871705 RepID=UPI002243BEF8|nr:hypothetical protein [Acidiphilium sp. PA]MCW8308387.1 hypothetical protein [Acidiphilium sp. PA]
MTPDRAEDQARVIASYRQAYVGAPERLKLIDAAEAGLIIYQEIVGPDRTLDDMWPMVSGRAPGVALLCDCDGAGPDGWRAARDLRAFGRVAAVVLHDAKAAGVIEVARQFGRAVVIECEQPLMRLWSQFFIKRMPVIVSVPGQLEIIDDWIH